MSSFVIKLSTVDHNSVSFTVYIRVLYVIKGLVRGSADASNPFPCTIFKNHFRSAMMKHTRGVGLSKNIFDFIGR